MRSVLIYLFLALTAGCTTTKTQVVTQYKTQLIKPPAAYLLSCTQPYHSPPQTWGDAARRDPVWLMYFDLCASRIENLRRCYNYPEQCGTLPEGINEQ
ncbi:Rz1-like lysis system protein LysC [Photobacterium sp. SP02]|uniref:Rz1-like lysis system protein LysC n=1 Tax=Photobacterium sp. SP02 TaxID=3032280 RepID=UPI00406CB2D0